MAQEHNSSSSGTPSQNPGYHMKSGQREEKRTIVTFAPSVVKGPNHGIVASPNSAPESIASVREVVEYDLPVGIGFPLQQGFLTFVRSGLMACSKVACCVRL